MLNILVVEYNIEYCKKIINEFSDNDNLRFCAIANNEKDLKSVLTKQTIDIIIINVKIFQKLINKEIFNLTIYKSPIIFISENITIENLKNRLNYLVKPSEPIRNTFDLDIISKIKTELQNIGYNLKYNGTKYLIEAIYIIYNKKDYFDDNLEKDIYPIIAKKYNKSVNNIKCNIINATDTMFYECKEETLMNYLGFYETTKPGPKTIIFSVLNKLEKLV